MHPILQFAIGAAFISTLAPGAAAAKTPVPPKAELELTGRQVGSLRAALFDRIALMSSAVESLDDYDRTFLRGLPPRDRAAALQLLKPLKEFPSFESRETFLFAENELRRYRWEWPDLTKPEFVVNGVRWTYDRKNPLVPQLEKLSDEIDSAKGRSAFWGSLFPEAHAGIPFPGKTVTGWVGGAVVGAFFWNFLKDPIQVASCKVFDEEGTVMPECVKLRLERDKLLKEDAPALDAEENRFKASDEENILGLFEKKTEPCRIEYPGEGKKVYKWTVRSQEVVDEKKVPTSNWWEVEAKFEKRVPTDLIVRDPSGNKELGKDLVVHVTFDPTTKKPLIYRIPNPEYPPKRPVTIPLTPVMRHSSGEKLSVVNAKNLIVFVSNGIYNCAVEDVAKKQESKDPTVRPLSPPATQ